MRLDDTRETLSLTTCVRTHVQHPQLVKTSQLVGLLRPEPYKIEQDASVELMYEDSDFDFLIW